MSAILDVTNLVWLNAGPYNPLYLDCNKRQLEPSHVWWDIRFN